MSYGYWKPYVPVAKRREQAEKAAAKANKCGKETQPVRIEGRAIAKTFWGKAWCDNLEAYSDYENRLPRGRTYVRNGSVIDLKIEPGKVRALVVGSSLYTIEIGIAAVTHTHWKSLAKECTGSIASLVELLQGKLSKAVMEKICRPDSGLFPAPKDIQLDCSCPDWAKMCKHVAAVLYGVGARLDARPELLFTLRQVDANDLVTQAAELPAKIRKTPAKGKVLDHAQLADVFGIEMDAPAISTGTKKRAGTRRTKPVEPVELVEPVKSVKPAKPTAVATKKPPTTLVKKKAVAKKKTTTTAKKTAKKTAKTTTSSRLLKVGVPATVESAAARKPGNAVTAKRASQQIAVNTPAQTKRKKTQT